MFTVEQLSSNLGKVLDHLTATATPTDGGSTAAAAEALRNLVGSNPELQKQLTDAVNAKLEANKPAVSPTKTSGDSAGKASGGGGDANTGTGGDGQ